MFTNKGKHIAYNSAIRQRGVVVVLTAVALLSLVAMTGLALDGGHILLSKTRLQNIVDATALSAAKALDQSNNTQNATDAAIDAFTRNVNAPGNGEIQAAYDSNEINLEIEFSNTLSPFVPGSPPEIFVRIKVLDLSLQPWLIQVTGFTNKRVGATAVSGPSPTLSSNICSIAPVMMCGYKDTDLTDDLIYGYPLKKSVVLKHGSNQESAVGPGNFQLIRMGDGQGGSVIRDGTAGGYDPESCLSTGDSVETEPGNTVGPVVQGFNTRFGQYNGPVSAEEYPPDFETEAPDPSLRLNDDGKIEFSDGEEPYTIGNMSFSYDDYVDRYESYSGLIDPLKYHRRILTVPVGDCTGTTSGQGDVEIFGFMCVYLIQPVVQKGNEAHVFGQIVKGCDTSGTFSINPVTGPLPTKIILYKDPDNLDA